MDAAKTGEDLALVAVLYYAGLRVGEACPLRWPAIDLDARTLSVEGHWSRDRKTIQPGGKGEKPRTIPINERLVTILQRRKAEVPAEWVFPSGRKAGQPITPSTAWRKLKALARAAGLDPDRIWPHLMRHGTAEHQVEAGVPIDEVRDFLGHSSIAVTGLYLQTSQSRLRRAADALE